MYHNEFYFPTPAEVDGFYAALVEDDDKRFLDYCATYLDEQYADNFSNLLDYETAF